MTFTRFSCLTPLVLMALSIEAPDAAAQGRPSHVPCTPEIQAKGMQCTVELTLDPSPAQQQPSTGSSGPAVSHPNTESGSIAHGQGGGTNQPFGTPSGYGIYAPTGEQVGELDYVNEGQGYEEFRFRQTGASLFIETNGQGSPVRRALLGFPNADGEACQNGVQTGPTGAQYSFWADAEVHSAPNGNDISITVWWCGTTDSEILTGTAIWG